MPDLLKKNPAQDFGTDNASAGAAAGASAAAATRSAAQSALAAQRQGISDIAAGKQVAPAPGAQPGQSGQGGQQAATDANPWDDTASSESSASSPEEIKQPAEQEEERLGAASAVSGEGSKYDIEDMDVTEGNIGIGRTNKPFEEDRNGWGEGSSRNSNDTVVYEGHTETLEDGTEVYVSGKYEWMNADITLTNDVYKFIADGNYHTNDEINQQQQLAANLYYDYDEMAKRFGVDVDNMRKVMDTGTCDDETIQWEWNAYRSVFGSDAANQWQKHIEAAEEDLAYALDLRDQSRGQYDTLTAMNSYLGQFDDDKKIVEGTDEWNKRFQLTGGRTSEDIAEEIKIFQDALDKDDALKNDSLAQGSADNDLAYAQLTSQPGWLTTEQRNDLLIKIDELKELSTVAGIIEQGIADENKEIDVAKAHFLYPGENTDWIKKEADLTQALELATSEEQKQDIEDQLWYVRKQMDRSVYQDYYEEWSGKTAEEIEDRIFALTYDKKEAPQGQTSTGESATTAPQDTASQRKALNTEREDLTNKLLYGDPDMKMTNKQMKDRIKEIDAQLAELDAAANTEASEPTPKQKTELPTEHQRTSQEDLELAALQKALMEKKAQAVKDEWKQWKDQYPDGDAALHWVEQAQIDYDKVFDEFSPSTIDQNLDLIERDLRETGQLRYGDLYDRMVKVLGGYNFDTEEAKNAAIKQLDKWIKMEERELSEEQKAFIDKAKQDIEDNGHLRYGGMYDAVAEALGGTGYTGKPKELREALDAFGEEFKTEAYQKRNEARDRLAAAESYRAQELTQSADYQDMVEKGKEALPENYVEVLKAAKNAINPGAVDAAGITDTGEGAMNILIEGGFSAEDAKTLVPWLATLPVDAFSIKGDESDWAGSLWQNITTGLYDYNTTHGVFSDQQTNAFYYLLGKEGAAEAFKYAINVNNNLNAAYQDQIHRNYMVVAKAEAARQGKVGSVLNALATPFVSSLEAMTGVIDAVKYMDQLATFGATYNSGAPSLATIGQWMDEAAVKGIQVNYDNWKYADFLYGVYRSAVQSAETLWVAGIAANGIGLTDDIVLTMGNKALGAKEAFTGAFSDITFFGSAFADTYKSLEESGIDPILAAQQALCSGIFEAGFEHWSIENLYNVKNVQDWGKGLEGILNGIKETLIQGGIEGSEELFTDMANFLSEEALLGYNSEYQQDVANYVNQYHLTEEEAVKFANHNLAMKLGASFLAGSLSGFAGAAVRGGGAYASENSKSANEFRQAVGEEFTKYELDGKTAGQTVAEYLASYEFIKPGDENKFTESQQTQIETIQSLAKKIVDGNGTTEDIGRLVLYADSYDRSLINDLAMNNKELFAVTQPLRLMQAANYAQERLLGKEEAERYAKIREANPDSHVANDFEAGLHDAMGENYNVSDANKIAVFVEQIVTGNKAITEDDIRAALQERELQDPAVQQYLLTYLNDKIKESALKNGSKNSSVILSAEEAKNAELQSAVYAGMESIPKGVDTTKFLEEGLISIWSNMREAEYNAKVAEEGFFGALIQGAKEAAAEQEAEEAGEKVEATTSALADYRNDDDTLTEDGVTVTRKQYLEAQLKGINPFTQAEEMGEPRSADEINNVFDTKLAQYANSKQEGIGASMVSFDLETLQPKEAAPAEESTPEEPKSKKKKPVILENKMVTDSGTSAREPEAKAPAAESTEPRTLAEIDEDIQKTKDAIDEATLVNKDDELAAQLSDKLRELQRERNQHPEVRAARDAELAEQEKQRQEEERKEEERRAARKAARDEYEKSLEGLSDKEKRQAMARYDRDRYYEEHTSPERKQYLTDKYNEHKELIESLKTGDVLYNQDGEPVAQIRTDVDGEIVFTIVNEAGEAVGSSIAYNGHFDSLLDSAIVYLDDGVTVNQGGPEGKNSLEPTTTESIQQADTEETEVIDEAYATGGVEEEVPAEEAPLTEEEAAEIIEAAEEEVPEEPVAEAPTEEEPVAEAPAEEEPVAETPAEEEPVAEAPAEEEPAKPQKQYTPEEIRQFGLNATGEEGKDTSGRAWSDTISNENGDSVSRDEFIARIMSGQDGFTGENTGLAPITLAAAQDLFDSMMTVEENNNFIANASGSHPANSSASPDMLHASSSKPASTQSIAQAAAEVAAEEAAVGSEQDAEKRVVLEERLNKRQLALEKLLGQHSTDFAAAVSTYRENILSKIAKIKEQRDGIQNFLNSGEAKSQAESSAAMAEYNRLGKELQRTEKALASLDKAYKNYEKTKSDLDKLRNKLLNSSSKKAKGAKANGKSGSSSSSSSKRTNSVGKRGGSSGSVRVNTGTDAEAGGAAAASGQANERTTQEILRQAGVVLSEGEISFDSGSLTPEEIEASDALKPREKDAVLQLIRNGVGRIIVVDGALQNSHGQSIRGYVVDRPGQKQTIIVNRNNSHGSVAVMYHEYVHHMLQLMGEGQKRNFLNLGMELIFSHNEELYNSVMGVYLPDYAIPARKIGKDGKPIIDTELIDYVHEEILSDFYAGIFDYGGDNEVINELSEFRKFMQNTVQQYFERSGLEKYSEDLWKGAEHLPTGHMDVAVANYQGKTQFPFGKEYKEAKQTSGSTARNSLESLTQGTNLEVMYTVPDVNGVTTFTDWLNTIRKNNPDLSKEAAQQIFRDYVRTGAASVVGVGKRKGNTVTRVSTVTAADIKNSPLARLIMAAKDNGFIDSDEVTRQLDFLAETVDLINHYKDSDLVWEVLGSEMFAAIKDNSDPQYGRTIDFSTICKKTQATIDAIGRTMEILGSGLSKEEIKYVYQQVGLAGESTPCPVCYVFSRWMGLGSILDNINNFQEKYGIGNEQELFDMVQRVYDATTEVMEEKGLSFGKAINEAQSRVDKQIKNAMSSLMLLPEARENAEALRTQIAEWEANYDTLSKTKKEKLESNRRKLANYDTALARTEDEWIAEIDRLNEQSDEFDAYKWAVYARVEEQKNAPGKFTLRKDFKPVPPEVLFNLNRGEEFAKNYPGAWVYRTTRGSGLGKAILPYSDARVGETIQGVAGEVKNIKIGESNPFMHPDKMTASARSTLEKAIQKMASQNLIGGMRFQSTSDFRYEYASDYLMTFFEMQAMGANVQLYTKVIEAVDFFANVGCDVNLSVMPKNKGLGVMETKPSDWDTDYDRYYTYENGKYTKLRKGETAPEFEAGKYHEIVYSDVTGVNGAAARTMVQKYDNVQMIMVGISADHINACLDSDDITFVIPFHGSGNTTRDIQQLMNLLHEDISITDITDFSDYEEDHEVVASSPARDLRKKIVTGGFLDKADNRIPLNKNEYNILKGNPYLLNLFRRFYLDTMTNGVLDSIEIERNYQAEDLQGLDFGNAEEFYKKYYLNGVNECYHTFPPGGDTAKKIFPYEYWDKSLTQSEAKANGDAFVEYCKSLGLEPRFSGRTKKGAYDKSLDFTANPNYWKLLIDRKMYDNNGNYRAQRKIDLSRVANDDTKQYNFATQATPDYGELTFGAGSELANAVNPGKADNSVMSKVNDPTKTEAIAQKAAEEIRKARAQNQDKYARFAADEDIQQAMKEADPKLAAIMMLNDTGVVNDDGELVPENGRNSLSNAEIAEEFDNLQRQYGDDARQMLLDQLRNQALLNPPPVQKLTNYRKVDNKETSQGTRLSKGQAAYFKNSTLRDGMGRLYEFYRGTRNLRHTFFDFNSSRSGHAMFLTNNRDVANSYAGSLTNRSYMDIGAIQPADEVASELTTRITDLLERIFGTRDIQEAINSSEEWRDSEFIFAIEDLLRASQSGELPTQIENGKDALSNLLVMLDNARSEAADEVQSLIDLVETASNAGTATMLVNLERPFIIDGQGEAWDNIPVNDEIADFLSAIQRNPRGDNITRTNEIALYAYAHGYDGVVIQDVMDISPRGEGIVNRDESLDMSSDVIAVFDSNQAKDIKNLNPTESDDYRFSLVHDVVDTNGNTYGDVLRLAYPEDTSIFDTRNSMKYFARQFLAGKTISVVNNNGNEETITFARRGDVVEKHLNQHAALDELSYGKLSGPISRLIYLNAEEAFEAADAPRHIRQNPDWWENHEWFDEKGWDWYNGWVMDKDNKLYPFTLHVAKTRDGRSILYDAFVGIRNPIDVDIEATAENNPNEDFSQPPVLPKPARPQSAPRIQNYDGRNALDSGTTSYSLNTGMPIKQEFSSADTSINATLLPSTFKSKWVHFVPGGVNIDVGGGKFDNASDYLRAAYDVNNMVLDPFNRVKEFNQRVTDMLQRGERADTVTCNNCLNVIKEQEIRDNVILECAKAIKPGGEVYFKIYEGTRNKDKTLKPPGPSKTWHIDENGKRVYTTSWQENRPAATYVGEIEKFFKHTERHGDIIVATDPIDNLPEAYWQLNAEGDYVRFSLGAPSDLTDAQLKNYNYNQQQNLVGGTLKHLSGTPQHRFFGTKAALYSDGVGKEVSGTIYFHKNYVSDVIADQELLNRAIVALEAYATDFDYNCIAYTPKTGTIRFDEAPDFDTAREPIPGRQITVTPDGRITRDQRNSQIWHHKWQWVKNDYTGFDVEQSWNWSKTYLSTLRPVEESFYVFSNNKGKGSFAQKGIPDAAVWDEQLDYYGLPHDEPGEGRFSLVLDQMTLPGFERIQQDRDNPQLDEGTDRRYNRSRRTIDSVPPEFKGRGGNNGRYENSDEFLERARRENRLVVGYGSRQLSYKPVRYSEANSRRVVQALGGRGIKAFVFEDAELNENGITNKINSPFIIPNNDYRVVSRRAVAVNSRRINDETVAQISYAYWLERNSAIDLTETLQKTLAKDPSNLSQTVLDLESALGKKQTGDIRNTSSDVRCSIYIEIVGKLGSNNPEDEKALRKILGQDYESIKEKWQNLITSHEHDNKEFLGQAEVDNIRFSLSINDAFDQFGDELSLDDYNPSVTQSDLSENLYYSTDGNTAYYKLPTGETVVLNNVGTDSPEAQYINSLEANNNANSTNTTTTEPYTIPPATRNERDGYSLREQDAGLRRGTQEVLEENQEGTLRRAGSHGELYEESGPQSEESESVNVLYSLIFGEEKKNIKGDPTRTIYNHKGEKITTEDVYPLASFERFLFKAFATGDYSSIEDVINEYLDRTGGFSEEEIDLLDRMIDINNAYTDEQREAWHRALDEAVAKHGIMKPKRGDKNPNVVIPKKTDDGQKTRGHVRNVAANADSEILTERLQRDRMMDALLGYTPLSNAKSLDAAERIIEREGGLDGAMAYFEAVVQSGKVPTAADIALGDLLISEYAKDPLSIDKAAKLVAEMSIMGTNLGQAVQAMAIIKKMTAKGQLYYLEGVVKHLNKVYEKRINDPKNKMKEIRINDALKLQLLSASTEKQINDAVEAIKDDLAKQIPPTWVDKWNAWRYLAMLGNPRTHIRNFVGNGAFMPAVFIKDMVARELEKNTNWIDASARTKVSGRTAAEKEAFRKYAAEDYKVMTDILKGKKKGNKFVDANDIVSRRQIFDTKFLDQLEKYNGQKLEDADLWFMEKYYVRTLAEALQAKGVKAEDLKNSKFTESAKGKRILNEARAWAVREAQRDTYHDANAFAATLNQLKNKNAVANVLLEGLVPFTKTPLNIMKRAIEYSPIGLISSAIDLKRELRSGNKNTAEILDRMAAGLTGTGIMILGAFLSAIGVLRGIGPDDDKEAAFEKLQGHQNWSIEFPFFGNKKASYTIDWMAPMALPLFVGGTFWDLLNGEVTLESAWDIGKALSTLADPMLAMSMLDGLETTLASVASANDASSLSTLLTSMATSYAAQGMPTLFGQIARTIDDTRRATYVDKNSSMPSGLQRFLQTSIMGKLPLVESQKMAYVDEWGRTDTQDNMLLRALENFVSPGYANFINETPVDTELARLADAVGGKEGKDALPSKVSKSIGKKDIGKDDNGNPITIDGKELTAEEYQKYAEVTGQASYQLLAELFSTPEYNEASDTDKLKMVSDAFDFASSLGKREIIPERGMDAAWMDVAEDFGVAEYLAIRQEYDENKANDRFYNYVVTNPNITDEQTAILLADKMNVPNYIDSSTTGYQYQLRNSDDEPLKALYQSMLAEGLPELKATKAYQEDDPDGKATRLQEFAEQTKAAAFKAYGQELTRTDRVLQLGKASSVGREAFSMVLDTYNGDPKAQADWLWQKYKPDSTIDNPNHPGYVFELGEANSYDRSEDGYLVEQGKAMFEAAYTDLVTNNAEFKAHSGDREYQECMVADTYNQVVKAVEDAYALQLMQSGQGTEVFKESPTGLKTGEAFDIARKHFGSDYEAIGHYVSQTQSLSTAIKDPDRPGYFLVLSEAQQNQQRKEFDAQFTTALSANKAYIEALPEGDRQKAVDDLRKQVKDQFEADYARQLTAEGFATEEMRLSGTTDEFNQMLANENLTKQQRIDLMVQKYSENLNMDNWEAEDYRVDAFRDYLEANYDSMIRNNTPEEFETIRSGTKKRGAGKAASTAVNKKYGVSKLTDIPLIQYNIPSLATAMSRQTSTAPSANITTPASTQRTSSTPPMVIPPNSSTNNAKSVTNKMKDTSKYRRW